MKKFLYIILAVGVLFSLSACGASTSKQLEGKEWSVVANNGQAGTLEFGNDVAMFDLGILKVGMDYEIKNDEITFSLSENGEVKKSETYEIEKKKDGFFFKTIESSTGTSNGDLTLTPKK